MQTLFNILDPERRKILEKIIKVEGYANSETSGAKKLYRAEFERRMKVNSVSEAELNEYKAFKIKEEIKAKELKEKEALFANGIKFKSKAEMQEYLVNIGLSAQLKFALKCFLNWCLNKIKINKIKA